MRLSDLKALASNLGLNVLEGPVKAKQPYLEALRAYYFQRDYPTGCPYSELEPMKCFSYYDLSQREQDALWADKSGWVVQTKFNGQRLILHWIKDVGVFCHGRETNKTTFRRTEYTAYLPFTVVPKFTATVDCEATSTDLQHTLSILKMRSEASLEAQKKTPLVFHVFDIVRWEAYDLRLRPLDERLAFLGDFREAIAGIPGMEYFEFPQIRFQGKKAFFDGILDSAGEGCVFKLLTSPYIDSSSRSRRGWVKIKRQIEIAAYVSGCEPGKPGSVLDHRAAIVYFSVTTERGEVLIAKVSTLPWSWIKANSYYDRATKTVALAEGVLGKVAIICGMELSRKSRRLISPRWLGWRSDLTKDDCRYSFSDIEAVRNGSTSVVLARIVSNPGMG